VEAAGFSYAEDFADFAAFDDFAGGAALAIEPGHEVLQAHLVFFFRLKNQDLNRAETVGGDAAAFEFQRAGDGFEERGGFDFDDVGAAFDVGESDAAVTFGHGEGRLAYSLFVRQGQCKSELPKRIRHREHRVRRADVRRYGRCLWVRG